MAPGNSKFLIVIIALNISFSTCTENSRVKTRPADWAVPLKVEGVPNLYAVSDSLYRGAQPTAEGMKNLKRMGIKTIINLRALDSDRELLAGTHLGYVHIPIRTSCLRREHAISFLNAVLDRRNQPTFVHCLHGADRTGAMVAIYRIVVQKWKRESAIREMTGGGFNFHPIFQNLVRFIRKADAEAYRVLSNPGQRKN